MKKILILRSNIAEKELMSYLRSNLGPDVDVIMGEFRDLTFDLRNGEIEVFWKEKPITDFNLVWIRFGRTNTFIAFPLALALDFLKVDCWDRAWSEGKIGNKLSDFIILTREGLPVPRTFFCHRERILKYAPKIARQFGYPLVAKDINEDRGGGVFILKNLKDFQKLVKESNPKFHFLFQKFIPNDGDYRILVVNNQVVAWEKKTRIDDKFRNNISLGGKEDFFPVDKIPHLLKEYSLKAAKALNLQLAGVDIVVDQKEETYWFLEVNRGPSFTTDVKVSPEMPAVAEALMQKLAK